MARMTSRHEMGLYRPAASLLRSAERSRPAGKDRRIMDIVGVGTDIVECLRIGRMIDRHGELFLNRIYTPREIRYCQRRKRALDHFAARWAGKEAVFKALGMGVRRGLEWTDIAIHTDELG